MSAMGNENELIARIEARFPPSKSNGLRVAMGDDAALWQTRVGWEVVLTCDWFLEGSHFLRYKHPADAVGWKCLARAVSDIAAMGGVPRCFLLSVALPASLTGNWLDEFLGGLRRASTTLRCALAGGDTTRHEKVLINVTVIGEVRRAGALLRSGANRGDAIFVSGTLGQADAGLRELKRKKGAARTSDRKLRKHLYPEPRLALGRWLSEHRLATSAMDLSDGLSSDLPRLCAASGVGAKIDVASLPRVAGLASRDAQELALHGGDDYELLFTVARKNLGKIPSRIAGLKLTQIGEIVPGRKIVVNESGKILTMPARGWDPFRK
jgi:thiamine-monophosphate kinase